VLGHSPAARGFWIIRRDNRLHEYDLWRESLGSFMPGNDDAEYERTCHPTVVISPQWSMLEDIEFHRLVKLRPDVLDDTKEL